ncbi:type IV pilin protein [Dyella sp. C9]|uniref:type IV pilin protein n=1 Tax=Dyella sp. C9 TaxID=2202154 RepID=UPI000DEFF171|nr:type IV pilin protein [Dyella sp. C9]
MERQKGFSLIELLVVVLIIAILAGIAIPTYQRYVVRAHRTEARRALLELAGKQERYYYSHNSYTDELDLLSTESTIDGGRYVIEVSSASATDFTLTATAAGLQQHDDAACQSLVLTKAGARRSTGTAENDPQCWGG